MRAGYADVDITPPPGEELTGYGYYLNRRATGALDRLMARVVALDEGGGDAEGDGGLFVPSLGLGGRSVFAWSAAMGAALSGVRDLLFAFVAFDQ